MPAIQALHHQPTIFTIRSETETHARPDYNFNNTNENNMTVDSTQ